MESGPLNIKVESRIDMKLYATPLSHFSRKVRILLDLYEINYEFADIGNVAQTDSMIFGGNPILRVPVLADNKNWLWDSDNIAKYIVEKFDPSDRFRVNNRDFNELNVRSVLNGIMSEEVKLIIARRTGLSTEGYEFFDKSKLIIKNGLDWLESNAAAFNSKQHGYLEFHLICLWQHLDYYELTPLPYPNLGRIVESVLTNAIVARSSPFILKPKAASK